MTFTRGEIMTAREADQPTATTTAPGGAESTCTECGNTFPKKGNSKTCGPECSVARDRKRSRSSSHKTRAKPAPQPEPEPTRAALVDELAADLAEAVKARTRELLGL